MSSTMGARAPCQAGASLRLAPRPAGAARLRAAGAVRAPRRAAARAAPRADRDGGFSAGFIVGGVVFGALGFLFAPQISRALLGDDARLRLPRFLDDDDAGGAGGEVTKESLAEKIAALNSAIDDVSHQLRERDLDGAPRAAAGAANN